MRRVGSKGRRDVDELEVLKRELTKARTKGDFKEVSNLHNRIGILYRELSHYDEALDEHEEEAIVTRKYFPEDVLGLGMALRAKGEVYLDMKEEEKALPLVREYLRLSLSAGDLVEEQRAHVTLGRVFFALALRFAEEEGRLMEKQNYLKKAEKEFITAKDLANDSKIRISDSESVEMKCGVFVNLFLVLDCAGRSEEGLGYLRKAVEMAEGYSLHELMFRAHLSFYEVHVRNKAFEEAAASAQLAANTAKALRDPKLQAEARLLQAKANFLRSDVEGGAAVLKRIRKDKKEFICVEEELEPLLRSAVRIMRSEDKIHFCNDDHTKAKLHEILGDKYVEIGNYIQAVTNYELALKLVEENSIGDKKKAELLFSLAETLSDLGNFPQAKKVYLSELRIHENKNPREAFKTQARLSTLLEKGDFPEEEVLDSYQSAVNFAKEALSPSKEIDALSNYAVFLKSRNRKVESEKILQEVESLRKMYPFAEDENSEKLENGGNESDSGSSIDLDQLTSDDGESDDPEETATKAITVAKKKFRLNEKGETPLHVAAKKGDQKAVRRLLRQGHEVNPRDSAGWIPLHEAANFGHFDVVQELLKNGARINDQPAGSNCDKITPIHDAAANGHVDVVRLFIDHGANVLLKDANGNYPIDALLICFQRGKDSYSDEEKLKFKDTLDLLKRKMVEGGKVYGKDAERRAKRKAKDWDEAAEAQPSFLLQMDRGDRVPVTVGLDDFDPDDGEAAVDFYSTTIRGLRGKKRKEPSVERESRKQKHAQALIAEEEYVDEDWLDDDLRGRTSKRKRETRAGDLPQSPRRKKENRRDDVTVLYESNRNENSGRKTSNVRKPSSSSLPKEFRRSTSFQINSDSDSSVDLTEIGQTSPSPRTLIDLDSNSNEFSPVSPTSASVPIRNEGDFSRITARVPSLPSSTTILSPEPIVVFSRPDVRLRDARALSNSLQNQFALKEINLSGALMLDEGAKGLRNVLPTLLSLESLDLSLNGLTPEGINHLRDAFANKPQQNEQGRSHGMVMLNLNFNPLGDNSGHSLSQLLALFGHLKKLFLADTDIGPKTVEESPLPALLAKLQLEELDLRYNEIREKEQRYLHDSGAFSQIKMLNTKKFNAQYPFW